MFARCGDLANAYERPKKQSVEFCSKSHTHWGSWRSAWTESRWSSSAQSWKSSRTPATGRSSSTIAWGAWDDAEFRLVWSDRWSLAGCSLLSKAGLFTIRTELTTLAIKYITIAQVWVGRFLGNFQWFFTIIITIIRWNSPEIVVTCAEGALISSTIVAFVYIEHEFSLTHTTSKFTEIFVFGEIREISTESDLFPGKLHWNSIVRCITVVGWRVFRVFIAISVPNVWILIMNDFALSRARRDRKLKSKIVR